MRKLTPARRRAVMVAGVTAALPGILNPVFAHLHQSNAMDALHGLLVGIPLGMCLLLSVRMGRECRQDRRDSL